MSNGTTEKLANARLMRRIQDLEAELSQKDQDLQSCQQELNTAKAAFSDSEIRVKQSGKEPDLLQQVIADQKQQIDSLQRKIEYPHLHGIIHVCTTCKTIREGNDKSWESFETFFENRTEIMFSHGICVDCAKILYGDRAWFSKKF